MQIDWDSINKAAITIHVHVACAYNLLNEYYEF